MQRTLSKLRLAAALNSLFDYLVWNCHCDRRGSSGMAAEAQQVRSPEVAVKIQFLRLVHSFCDHSEYKRVILSREEIDEIIKYNSECYFVYCANWQGLLSNRNMVLKILNISMLFFLIHPLFHAPLKNHVFENFFG